MEASELDLQERKGQILVYSRSNNDLESISRLIEVRLPGTGVYPVSSDEEYNLMLNGSEIDVAIVDFRLIRERVIELVYSSKIKDTAPSVIIFAGVPDPQVMSAAYEAGCYKYFVEQEDYGAEMAHVVNHIMRLRKLQEEKLKLVSRLTEANILLEEKNRRLDEFSATVAHDIRGPLGGVVMKLDFLLDRYKDEISEQFATVLNRALASSQRLTDVVQAMYEFAKLGSKAAAMGHVDLGRLVDEVVHDMNFDSALDLSIVIGELPAVWGSDQLLRRVFINLIGNAVKYNDKPETVVQIRCEGFNNRSLSRFATISVEDNGPGIDEKDLKDIFRFFSRGTAGKKDNDGLGVGLTVVQRIVELHFGTITVESQLGKGTAFSISLPTEKIDFIR